jgi:4-amino-4-deoxy-L-arabinose transferase-like glycosyltransferase
VTRRLYDRRAAFFAAALFAGLAATQFLGALATYDAMALFLIAGASWLAVVAAGQPVGRQAGLLLAAGAALALSNATKYAAGIFDPVVVCLAAAAAWRARGPAAAARAGVITLTVAGGLLACGLLAGGAAYRHGLDTTTLTRQAGSDSISFLLYASFQWIGVVALLAGLGAVAAVTARQGRPFAVLTCVLAAAVLLVPIEQARIHTYTSMFKHDDYGAWFGSAAAGYALAALARLVPRAKALPAFQAGLAAALVAVLPAVPIATARYGWPDTSTAIARLRSIVARHPGPIMADDGQSLLNYYLGNEVRRDPITGNWYYAYTSHGKRLTGDAAYEAAVASGHFAVIMLDFWDSPKTDDAIARAIALNDDYRLVAVLPYTATGVRAKFHIWVRTARP